MKDTIQNYFKGNYRTFYEKYLPDVKKIGGEEYKALCTFHDDTEPSFNFDNQTGQYFCHGCNKNVMLSTFTQRLIAWIQSGILARF